MPARMMSLIGDEPLASVSHRTGIPRTTLSSILEGTIPRADRAVKIAKALGVTVEWLVTGDEQ
jgi:lambda repressor-like predicted transcriptional regulator